MGFIAPIIALLASACAEATGLSGLVSIADGDPFTIIRGDRYLTAVRGVTLQPGDLIETGASNWIAVELQDHSLLAIGPSSRVYLLDRGDAPTAALVRGWLKFEARGSEQGAPGALHRAVGLRLGAATRLGVALLRSTETADAVFDEAGSVQLLVHDDGEARVDRDLKANQFVVREGRAAVAVAPRPSSAFVSDMPVPFRDPLPDAMSKRKGFKATEPKFVREVSYADVAGWLAVPRDWRSGFTNRFRGRLHDPEFFAAMDTHLDQHPEWTLILHPPPPPEENDAAAHPPGNPRP
jgi:hypothetical protein